MSINNIRTPVVGGLMEETPDGPRLLGAQCSGCKSVYFPTVATCRNPDCKNMQVETTSLPQCGVLYSYTVQHYRPPALFRMDNWEPYAIGLVEMEGGLRVMGMVTGIEIDSLCVGQTLEVVFKVLYNDPEAGEVLTYMFAPTDNGVVVE